MSKSLSNLESFVGHSLSRQGHLRSGEALYDFRALRIAREAVERRFDQVEKALVPPLEKRRAALNKFRSASPLNPSEWRLVFSGLADADESSAPMLEDDRFFGQVHQEVEDRIRKQTLSRRDWLGLCFSYFFYDTDEPGRNENWHVLRGDIRHGFEAVKRRTAREREWMRIVSRYWEVFGDQAGTQLAEQMFQGEIQDLSALQAIAQIPDSSWLWRRIFTVLLSRIFDLKDDEFIERLPGLVELGRHNVRYFDRVLSACLTRYYQSRYREQSSTLLKQVASEHWGSPQIRSKQNSWLQHVEKPVCAMVVGWFAKEDLQHFFTLLKGGADVDQARLFYWLRFANQMSYTRIVMGQDAWSNRGGDFVEFRNKNKGRLSQLAGGPSHNNAVIMQIGNYYFVEFSGTGNACYVYKAETAPFNPDKTILGLSTELKQKRAAAKWLSHNPAPSAPTRIEGWLLKFDLELRSLGITPQTDEMLSQSPRSQTASPTGRGWFSADNPVAKARSSQPDGKHKERAKESKDPLLAQLKELLQHVDFQVHDKRHKGGVVQIKLLRTDAQAVTALHRLGFKPVNHNPLVYWRR